MAQVSAPRLCPKCGGGYHPPSPPATVWGRLERLIAGRGALSEYGPAWSPFAWGRYEPDTDSLRFRCGLCGYDLALEPADREGEHDG